MASSIKVTVLGDISSLHRALGEAGLAAESFGKKLGTLAKYATVAAGAAGLGGLYVVMKTGIAEFTEQTKVAAQTNAVIKSTGDVSGVTAKQVSGLASALSQMSGIDDEVVQTGENMLLTFTNIRNVVGKGNDIFTQASKAVLDMDTAMTHGNVTAESMGKMSILVGKALQDPIKGMTSLRRVGVALTESQQATIKSMVESGNVMGAQKIILGELNREFGGSAKAYGETVPGALSKMRNAFAEVSAQLVGAMAPAVGAAASAVSDFLTKIQNAQGAGEKFKVVVDGIRELAGKAWEGLKAAFNAINWAAVWDVVVHGIQQVPKLSVDVLHAVGQWATDVNNAIKTSFAGINWSSFITQLGHDTGTAVVTALNNIVAWVDKVNWAGVGQEFVKGMEKAIGGLILYLASVDWGKVLVAVAKGLTLALRVQMEILFGVAKELGGQIVHGIGSGLDALAGVVASAFKGLGHMIASAFNAALDAVVKVAIQAALQIIEPFSHIPSKGGQWARDLKDKFNAALEGMDAKKPLANALNGTAQLASNAGSAAGKAFGDSFAAQAVASAGNAVAAVTGAGAGATNAGLSMTSTGVVAAAKQRGVGSGAVYQTGGGRTAGVSTVYDCSGYIYSTYTSQGFKSFPGTSETQWSTMSGPNWTSEKIAQSAIKPGDVVFFTGSGYAPPGHVGIVVSGSGANAVMMEYTTSGEPAKTATVGSRGDYIGAKRFYLVSAQTGGGGGGGGGAGGTAATPAPTAVAPTSGGVTKKTAAPTLANAVALKQTKDTLQELGKTLAENAKSIPDVLEGPIAALQAKVAKLLAAAHPTAAQLTDANRLISEMKHDLENALKFDTVVQATSKATAQLQTLFKSGLIPPSAIAAVKANITKFQAEVKKAMADGVITDAELKKITADGKLLQDTAKNALDLKPVLVAAKGDMAELHSFLSKGLLDEDTSKQATAAMAKYKKDLATVWKDGVLTTAEVAKIKADEKVLSDLGTNIGKALADQKKYVQGELSDFQSMIESAGAGIGIALGQIVTPATIAAAGKAIAGLNAQLKKAMSPEDFAAIQDQIAGYKTTIQKGIDSLVAEINDDKTKVAAAWTAFGAMVETALGKIAGQFQAGIDDVTNTLNTADLANTLAKATDAFTAAAAGDPDLAALFQQQADLWKAYYADLAQQNFDGAKALIPSLIAVQNAIDTHMKAVPESAQDAAAALSAAGTDMVNAIKQTGEANLTQALKNWSDLTAKQHDAIMGAINQAQADVDSGKKTLPEALEGLRAVMVANGLSPAEADKLLNDPLTTALKNAIATLNTAVAQLTQVLIGLATALGLQIPGLSKAAQSAADAVANPWIEAAGKINKATGEITAAVNSVSGAGPGIVNVPTTEGAAGGPGQQPGGTNIETFAAGGEVFKKQLAWVGEAGHEFIIPANKLPGPIKDILHQIVSGGPMPTGGGSYSTSPFATKTTGHNITVNFSNYVGDKRELVNMLRTELQRINSRNS